MIGWKWERESGGGGGEGGGGGGGIFVERFVCGILL